MLYLARLIGAVRRLLIRRYDLKTASNSAVNVCGRAL